MLVAPSIQHRIVVYTENRLKETMPLSPQELRAQKDMVRATYAAEQSRTVQELAQEREKRFDLRLAHEALTGEASKLYTENAELKVQIDGMSVEAADLRSVLRQKESQLEQFDLKIGELEGDIALREREMEDLRQHMNRVAIDRDNLKIDLAARNTQHESERRRVQSLRDERDGLRREVRLLTARAKEAEKRLEQEEKKALRLNDRLSREQAATADRETLVERRTQEIDRLHEKIKALTQEAREGRKPARNPMTDRKTARKTVATPFVSEEIQLTLTMEDVRAMKDELRHQSAALAERLVKSRSTTRDAALREELASVAARMVAVTAAEEGPSSPIHGILTAGSLDRGPHPSLANRIRTLIPQEQKTV